MDDFELELEFLGEPDQRNHDLRFALDAFLLHERRGLENGPGLHLGNLGIGDAEAATAKTEHGIELVQFMHAFGDFLDIHPEFFRQGSLRGMIVREEFVQGRVEEPDRGRQTF